MKSIRNTKTSSLGIELFIWGLGLLTLLAGAVGVANILLLL